LIWSTQQQKCRDGSHVGGTLWVLPASLLACVKGHWISTHRTL